MGTPKAVSTKRSAPLFVSSALGGLITTAIAWWILQSHDLIDDAYITAHYAQNFAAGHGWVWNIGEAPTNGTTTPLWTFILAVGLRAGASIIPLALVLNATFYGCMTAAACTIAGRHGRWIGLFSITILMIGFSPLLLHLAGMETTLYGAILVASIAWWDSGRFRTALACASVLPLIRGEGVLLLAAFLPAITLSVPRDRRGRVFLSWMATFVPFVAWELFSITTFHSWLPISFLAKHAQTSSLAGKITVESFVSMFITVGWLPSSGVWLFLGSLLVIPAARHSAALTVSAIWLLLYIAFYSLLAHVPQQGWYVAPTWWMAAVLLATGIGYSFTGRRRGFLVGAISIPLLLGILTPAWSSLALANQGRLPEGDPQLASQRGAAAYLHAHLHGLVAAAEVGVIGYYSGHPVVDIEGLVSPAVIQHLATEDYAWPIIHYRPRYLFLWPPLHHRPCVYTIVCRIWKTAWVVRHYRKIVSWPILNNVAVDEYGLFVYTPK